MRFLIALILISICSLSRLPSTPIIPLCAFSDVGESIAVFAPDCETPKTVFAVGDKVCAVASEVPLGPPAQRRFEWVAPDGTIFQLGPDIISDPQADSIAIPTAGSFSQVGTWTVKTVNPANDGFSMARFIVYDPASRSCDLSVNMSGSAQVTPGSTTTFNLVITNSGPNAAENVKLTITVTNSIGTDVEQTAGPQFSGVVSAATMPAVLSVPELPANASAAFVMVCQLSGDIQSGTTVSSTATISSTTRELYGSDNAATATATVVSQPCTITCPANSLAVKAPGQCGAVVNYSLPGGAGNTGSNCGNVTCTPAPGSFFPIGSSNVICFGKTGSPCNFMVIVEDPQTLTLNCPSDITVSESSPGMGLSIVSYKLPTLGDNCSTDPSACSPPSGSSFPLGTTTVSCEVSNSSGQKASCAFSITVDSSNCTLESVENITKLIKSDECSVVVNYSLPSASGRCGTIKCNPPPDSFFPIGSTAVTCKSKSGASSSFVVTVQSTRGPEITQLSAIPSSLVPSNGKFKELVIQYTVKNNCSGRGECVLSVSSNEASGRKDAPPEWEIVDEHHVRLRALANGKERERIYTITVSCTDQFGNTTRQDLNVSVPRARR